MLSVFYLVASLILLILLAYRGVSVLILSPALALITILLSSGDPILATYTQIFMVKLSDFAAVYFPLFLLSAIFGKIMEHSGCALSIANYISAKLGYSNAMFAVVISCAILTYGGISLFVVAFTVYPIADELFRKSDTPKRLMPACIALGSFTFTMIALPGTPAIQNAIPCRYLGTNTFAAPVMGLIASIFLFSLGMAWLLWRLKIARAAGEGYGTHSANAQQVSTQDLPNIWIAVAPIALVILINYISIKYIIPNLDTAYLREAKYGSVDISTVASNWAIIIALFWAIVFLIITNIKRINIMKSINAGAQDSLSPVFNTASVVGYGAVINSSAGFGIVRDYIFSIATGNPIVASSIVTALLSAITGSASGGLSITLDTMGAKYIELANSAGVSLELIHRIMVISSGSLDILPHNGAVITLLAVCGLSHKDAYKDMAIASMLPAFLFTLLIVFGSVLFVRG